MKILYFFIRQRHFYYILQMHATGSPVEQISLPDPAHRFGFLSKFQFVLVYGDHEHFTDTGSGQGTRSNANALEIPSKSMFPGTILSPETLHSIRSGHTKDGSVHQSVLLLHLSLHGRQAQSLLWLNRNALQKQTMMSI